MFLVLTEMSTFTSIIKLFLLLVLFFVLLYGAHLFTKWYAKSGYVKCEVIEYTNYRDSAGSSG